MRISSTAFIAGLALAVIVPSAAQASLGAPSHEYPGHRLLPVKPDAVLVKFATASGRHLTVMQSGTAILDSARPMTRHVWTLSASRLDQLESALEQARFWSLLSRYDACHDCTSYSITYAGLTVQSRVAVREPWWKPGTIPGRLAPVVALLSRLAATSP